MADTGIVGIAPVSIAAAALSRGAYTLARSFRLHRRRGAFCHRGWCQQCRVTLADGSVVLACLTPSAGNSDARRPRALLRLAGALAEHLPPWFYESHFLRPRWLRPLYFGALRRLSSAPQLPNSTPSAAKSIETRRCDCLVVGGGLSGLGAATALARAGHRVLLIDAERLGGSARCIPRLAPSLQRALQEVRDAGVECREASLCVGLYGEPDRAVCAGAGGTLVVRFERLVVATGAYDRLLAVPGNDLPGIVGLRAFERLVASNAVPRSARIGIVGHEREVRRARNAAEAADRGIAWIAGHAELPEFSGTRHAGPLTAVYGRVRVRGVVLESAGRVACDLLVVAYSQPTYELQAQWGLSPDLQGDPAVLHPGTMAHERMLVVGEAAGNADLDHIGAAAAAAAAAWSAGQPVESESMRDTRVPQRAADDDAFLCLCEDVRVRDVRRAIREGYRDVELIKRHTGAGTGPCQGKLCHAELARCLRDSGLDVRLPTARPFVRPVPLACYAGATDA